jgi:hypothetical protein
MPGSTGHSLTGCGPFSSLVEFANWAKRLARAFALFIAVLFVVGLHSLFRVTPRMNHVRPRYVGVVCRLFVLSAFVVLLLLHHGDAQRG